MRQLTSPRVDWPEIGGRTENAGTGKQQTKSYIFRRCNVDRQFQVLRFLAIACFVPQIVLFMAYTCRVFLHTE